MELVVLTHPLFLSSFYSPLLLVASSPSFLLFCSFHSLHTDSTCVSSVRIYFLVLFFLSLLLLKVLLILLKDGSKREAKDGEGGEKGGRYGV